jgi:hypothetical protein
VHPWQGRIAYPFHIARQVLHQILDLTGNQRNQQQQSADGKQRDHDKHDRDGKRATQADPLEAIGKRIAQIGQHARDRKRHQYRRKQPQQVADHRHDGQDLPAAGNVLIYRRVSRHTASLRKKNNVGPLRRDHGPRINDPLQVVTGDQCNQRRLASAPS